MYLKQAWIIKRAEMQLAWRLYRSRRRAKLSRRAVAAQLCNVTAKDIALIELGVKSVRLSLVAKMLKLYMADQASDFFCPPFFNTSHLMKRF